MPTPQLDDSWGELLEAERILAKRSLLYFAKHVLNYKQINIHTHGDMIRALEAPTLRKLIVMPRGTFKSSISSVAYPIWKLLQDPNERIIINSEVYTNAKNWLREIKGQLLSEKFIELFGDWRTDTWNESEIIIAPRTKIMKESSLSVASVGQIRVGQHYTTMVFDDLNSNNNSGTTEGCEKVKDYFKLCSAILEPHGTMVVIGTRYSDNDVISFVLKNEIRG